MFFIILLISFFSLDAKAVGGPICDTIFKSSNVGCADQSTSNTSGGSYPLLFDAFNFNPSALPTFPTPFGVEGYYNNNKVNFALIKGTDKLGLGASSKASNTTYFSGVENYKVAIGNSNTSYKSSSLNQYINLGTALNVLKVPLVGALPLGLSYRYDPETKKWNFSPGLEIRTSLFSIGASYSEVRPDKYNDGYYDLQEVRKNLSMNVNLKLRNLLLGYSFLQDQASADFYAAQSSTISFSSAYTVRTQIFSGTLVTNFMSLSAAYRKQNDSRLQGSYIGVANYKSSHVLLGGAFKAEKFELGAFYNYVLNEDVSILVKIFF